MKRFFAWLLIMGLGWQILLISGSAPVVAEVQALKETKLGKNTIKKTIVGPSNNQIELTFKRQFVYNLVLFDGAHCQTTFCPEDIDTIYMVAKVKNIISANKTDVYFWPISKEFLADWAHYKEPQPGKLEIMKGNRVIKTISEAEYVLDYSNGFPGNPTGIKIGYAARKALADFKARTDLFYQSIQKYYAKYADYQKSLQDFAKNPKAFGDKPPEKPRQPVPPHGYISEAAPGFALNLTAGTYQIRFRNEKNEIVPRSVKKLVVFPALARGIGYEIISEDKWTYPTHSDDFSANVFALKDQVIYVKPFTELQYNSFYYSKLTKLAMPSSGRGLENQKIWIHLSPLSNHNTRLELTEKGKVIQKVKEKPYLVKQHSGSAFGYDIVEFKKNDPQEVPNFTAYKIVISKGTGAYSFQCVAANDRVIKASVRNLCTLRASLVNGLIFAALLPLIFGAMVIGIRFFKNKRKLQQVKPEK
jgi:hypothetical protein